MKVLLDTSVIVAGLFRPHEFHEPARRWLDAAADGRIKLIATSHCLAESFSVLTRLPIAPRITPSVAWSALAGSLLPYAEFVDLGRADYERVISSLVSRGIGGAIVFDALIAAAAELAGVDSVVTLNERDFVRMWPAGANRVVSPTVTSPPSV